MSRIEQLADELVETRTTQGRGVVRVANVNEAVAVAERLLEVGEAQWFRGQVENHAKLTPSLYRPHVDYAAAEAAMNRFSRWVGQTPGLQEIATSPDAILAVAQHYGLPTPFIDFSTSPMVAGYFAASATRPTSVGTESCVFCLKIEEADSFWSVRPGADPERIVISVANLWRLEAQHGTFVWCRYDDLNGPFPLDRILFPYSGEPAELSDDAIYPKRESALEALLREYFQAEEILRGSAVLAEIRRHVPMQTLSFDTPDVLPQYFITPPARHASWTESNLATWLNVPMVQWADVTKARVLSIPLNLTQEPNENGERCERCVLAALKADGSLRRSPTTLQVDGLEEDALINDSLSKILQRVWDNMASLPWSDAELGKTLRETVRCYLAAKRVREEGTTNSREIEQQTMKRLLGTPIRVELGGQGNIHSWAWVEEHDLLDAVRSDFSTILKPEEAASIIGHSFNTMMVSRSPSTLFDFAKLSQLFVRQFIPTQAVFYPEHPLFPTPARVKIIGPE